MANLSTNKSEMGKIEKGVQGIFSEDNLKKSADKISEYFDSASDSMKSLEKTLRENVEKRPLVALGGALLVGYLAGYLIKKIASPSKSNSSLTTH